MLVRWQAHRYMLGQSLNFFQDEFAGRVSQKVMQTALAVRDSVTKLIDVGVYVVVYFVGTAYLLAQSDIWLLVAARRVARRLRRRSSSTSCRASARSARSRPTRARR